jgi:hypothetical protein
MTKHIRQCSKRSDFAQDTRSCSGELLHPLPCVAVSNDVVFVRINHKGRPYGTHVDLTEIYCEHCSKLSSNYGECLHIRSAKSITIPFESNDVPSWYVDQMLHLKDNERRQIKSNIKKCKDIGVSFVQHLSTVSSNTFISLSVAALFRDGANSCLRIGITYDSIANKWTLSNSSPYRLTYIAMASIYLNYFGIIPTNGNILIIDRTISLRVG